jgi:hypothetical protein
MHNVSVALRASCDVSMSTKISSRVSYPSCGQQGSGQKLVLQRDHIRHERQLLIDKLSQLQSQLASADAEIHSFDGSA